MRCRECHAAIDAPAALDALTMKCGYCGHEQPVPDLAERRRLLLDEQRETRLRQEHAREREKDEREQREKNRARWWKAFTTPFALIPILIGPAIIAITV